MILEEIRLLVGTLEGVAARCSIANQIRIAKRYRNRNPTEPPWPAFRHRRWLSWRRRILPEGAPAAGVRFAAVRSLAIQLRAGNRILPGDDPSRLTVNLEFPLFVSATIIASCIELVTTLIANLFRDLCRLVDAFVK